MSSESESKKSHSIKSAKQSTATPKSPRSKNKSTDSDVLSVSDIRIIDIFPKLSKDDDAIALLPTVLRPELCKFILSGVNIGIASGIRRAICSEVKAVQLTFDVNDYETNDPFVNLGDFVQTIIRSIPIRQTASGVEFKIDFKNGTHIPQYITTNDLIPIKGKTKDLFDLNIPLIAIAPNKYAKIGRIYLTEGYENEHGTFCLSSGATCVPLDVQPYDMYTKTGVSSSVANPRKHEISFETNGDIPPKLLVRRACEEIITRLGNLRDLLDTMEQIDDYHKLTIGGENDTIGMIIHHVVCDIFPEINAISPSVDHINKVLTIRIRADNPKYVLDEAIENAQRQLEKIKAYF